MKESDKGWKKSAKLQAAFVAGLVIAAVGVDNRHVVLIQDHILSIAEMVLCACVGGRVGMQITQEIMNRASDDVQTIVQKFDPKDVAGLPD